MKDAPIPSTSGRIVPVGDEARMAMLVRRVAELFSNEPLAELGVIINRGKPSPFPPFPLQPGYRAVPGLPAAQRR